MHIHFHKIKMSLTRYFEKNALSNSIGKQVINLLHTDYAIDWDLICSAMLYWLDHTGDALWARTCV